MWKEVQSIAVVGIRKFNFKESFKSFVYFLFGRKKLYALINIYKSRSS